MSNVFNPYNDIVVGFKKEAETIINQLIYGSKEREVVLITGMGGLGKTTLAKRVYEEKNVVNHFDKRAWCTVFQEYDCKDLLNKIYNEVCGHKIEIDSVAEELRKSLVGRRYLIVLDDIWSVKAWEELNRVFPSCDNGSRIVLTSRQESVVSDAKIVSLPFFTIDESWELLQVKLFKGNTCPEELENVGREISKKCGGLPLVVGLIAGLLERVENSEKMWREFLITLNSSHSTSGDGIQSNDAIELSYKHLPNHLRPCLLYIAAIPEDKSSVASKLINLWISEGFINMIEKLRVEDEAEDYLNQLVCSNLIMVSKKKYDGSILKCMVHDLVRDFCLAKAKEENFLQVIKMEKKLDPTLNFTSHRICFHRQAYSDIPSDLIPWSSSIRTILVFPNQGYTEPNLPIYHGSWMAKMFEHLTILDLEAIRVYESVLSEVNSLIHLRYLALFIEGGFHVSPLSLENLEHLITLKLRSLVMHLPNFFLNMRSLRHLMITRWRLCGRHCEEESRSVIEANPRSEGLQTWVLPCSLTTQHEHLLRKLSHLKKLSCGVSKYPFPEIDFLYHLEYLELFSNCKRKPHLLNDVKLSKFPSSIKEIHLSDITLSLSAISILAQLPNLEGLALQSCVFEKGLEWNIDEETQFRKLKYLQLCLLDIKIWNISSAAESFPCLEQLHLTDCWGLRGVPSSFGDVLTLKVISVDRCSDNVYSSVKNIKVYAQDMGNEQLHFKIFKW